MSFNYISAISSSMIYLLSCTAGYSQTKRILHQDDFSKDLSQWIVEQMPGGTTTLKNQRLDINDAKGCTVWFKHKLSGSIMIEYDATMIKQDGGFDRVSDLNCFWMAIDPKNPKNIFADNKRGGSFKNYHPLRLYYVGYGANKNTTTRFRRYPGGGSRPCLPEHDLRDKKFLHKANKTLKIQIIANGSTIRYLRDGEVVFDFEDNNPFTEGWFGFRTVRNHMQIDNFKVFQLPPGVKSESTTPQKPISPPMKADPQWKCHIVQPDPKDHGPDGINIHDWDGDGDMDLFVNYEEGKYSRLYFNPGKEAVRKPWADFVEFKHGKCEDSGIGDLDGDGDIDYVANGGWVYFNPGKDDVRDQSKWVKMTLFDHEQRVPLVIDIDGDGLDDLVVGARSWFKQPVTGKHDAKNWKKYELGEAKWPMTCIPFDMDKDGDVDLVVADRRHEIFWYDNPGKNNITSKWPRKQLHPHKSMFIAIGDVNSDGAEDVLIAGGCEGTDPWKYKLTVLLRTNKRGTPTYKEILIDQPCGNFPKGVAAIDLNKDSKKNEILIIPKQGDIWTATYTGDAMRASNWKTAPIRIPGAETRKKMDKPFLVDMDGDGDTDIATTEENGGWGVIWFENPLNN